MDTPLSMQAILKQILGLKVENLSISQEIIDINVQMEYLDYARQLQIESSEAILEEKEQLFQQEFSTEQKKDLIARLAVIDDVSAYRTLERFVKLPDNDLVQWGQMALNQSRSLIESSLLEQNQVMVLTGLGGKGNKLRYFIVVFSKDKSDFTQVQKRVIKNEFSFVLEQNESEFESIEFDEYFASIKALIPFESNVRKILSGAVKECNQLGEFLSTHFLITNIKAFSKEEVKDFLEKSEQKKTESSED